MTNIMQGGTWGQMDAWPSCIEITTTVAPTTTAAPTSAGLTDRY